MHASSKNKHISGAERIIEEKEIYEQVISLIKRAKNHERGEPDFINISIEEIKNPIEYITSLPITLITHIEDGKETAKKVLFDIGIPKKCIGKAFYLIDNSENMRGAIIMDFDANRLEPDRERGIRASRMDITKKAEKELKDSIELNGLSKYFTNIKEALVLATKVSSAGTIAELCISDNPSYTTGYVSSKKFGYMRIPNIKKKGDSNGGRVFFVNDIKIDDYINYIEKTPIIIDKFGGLNKCNNRY